jgi:ABC-2 type transport system ATP-binding protein
MSNIVQVRDLKKHYRNKTVVDIPSWDIEAGKILGFIGPNGAGKTTLIRCLLGLASFQGSIEILGRNPYQQRTELLNDIAFIADTAVLPKWATAEQLLQFMEHSHPNFNRDKAERLLAETSVNKSDKVSALSKGMIVQLHLALVTSIDAKLLLLDEPTLGLDILHRQQFYEQLLNDYYDETRTILITTHQVEEIENLLTDVVFINRGQIILNHTMEALPEIFSQVQVAPDKLSAAQALGPIGEQTSLGSHTLLFEGQDQLKLAEYGNLSTPKITDIFIAKMTQGGQHVS